MSDVASMDFQHCQPHYPGIGWRLAGPSPALSEDKSPVENDVPIPVQVERSALMNPVCGQHAICSSGVLPCFRLPLPLPDIANTGRLPIPSFPQQFLHVVHPLFPQLLRVFRSMMSRIPVLCALRRSCLVPGPWFLVFIRVVYPLSSQSLPLSPSYI